MLYPIDWNITCALILLSSCLFFWLYYPKRRAIDVLHDLNEDSYSTSRKASTPIRKKESLLYIASENELEHAGFLSTEEQKAFKKRQRNLIIIITIFCLVFRTVLGFRYLSGIVPTILLGLSVSYIFSRYYLASCINRFQRLLEFHLPIVMEQIVMAVESGMDVIPAVGTILEIHNKQDSSDINKTTNPVIRILDIVFKLSQGGIPFEKALSEVSSRTNSNALRHAFVHLGLAQSEGGELVTPLRELSDATQAYYQETVELEIAKMPIKATLPLVLTFAGLIIFFISIPLVQISNITHDSIPKDTSTYARP
ncbi:MAG: hypothetical protein GYA55_05350 [SAR324 cluster bacterium]|uniref:Type II secretion system protein GspF domain-containing protein n=1 Tax=SAR324 cluster bacterium TaxID=2024889 RepID=A0A7X9IJ07_9DELT|nr:hypothetical protein [SAR324 cluster bacterium]